MLRGMKTKNTSTTPVAKGAEPTSSANENVAALVRLLARQAAREASRLPQDKE
jgi:hypothetical protein